MYINGELLLVHFRIQSFQPGHKKFLGKAVDIFTGFSCERFLGISADSEERLLGIFVDYEERYLGISADFPQNCYLG